MSAELHAFTNTGEPKFIVKDFMNEVATTIKWITDQCDAEDDSFVDNPDGENAASLLQWATLGLVGSSAENSAPSSPTASPRRVPSHPSYSPKKKLVFQFLKRARAAYGRTALCLSGGAAMGTYHFGIVKALHDEGVLPHIISGTSAGGVVGAFVGTRTDEEIDRDLNAEMLAKHLHSFGSGWKQCFKNLYQTGNLFDAGESHTRV